VNNAEKQSKRFIPQSTLLLWSVSFQTLV